MHSSKRSKSSWPPYPPPRETDEQLAARHAAEADAKRVSDRIDHDIGIEREQRKGRVGAKVLLLGQAESGKSTVLKNFQLHFAPKAFAEDAEVWRPVIHLNLVRSVNFILNFLATRYPAAQEQNSLMRQPSFGSLSGDLRKLCIRLGPLRQVEESLIKGLAGSSSTLPADASKPQQYNPARASEVAIPSGTGWKKHLKLRRGSVDAAGSRSSMDRDRSEDILNRRILAACSQDIAGLWEDPYVKHSLRSSHIMLEEQPGFFLDQVARITQENYTPIPDDILKARVTTVGPEEHVIHTEGVLDTAKEWIIYDVGGSQSKRAAWAQFFDDANVMIFLAPISAFNQVLAEDERVNRLRDTMTLWKEICHNKILASVCFVLFINKLDILEIKLRSGIQFGQYFPSYENRPNDTKSVASYMLDVFKAIHKEQSIKRRKLHPHLTCTTDTRATSAVIQQIHEVILVNVLSDINIL